MSVARPPLRVLLIAHLKADPRKSVVLAVLAIVMVVLYGRWFWSSPGPGMLEAAGPVSAVTPATPPAVTALPARAGGPVRPRVKVHQAVARELVADPFALDLQRYPPAPDAPDASPDKPTDELIEDPVDAAARALTLQSTVCGARPLACINGEFLRPGQWTNGFQLERVEPTHVVLGREGVKVELYLKR